MSRTTYRCLSRVEAARDHHGSIGDPRLDRYHVGRPLVEVRGVLVSLGHPLWQWNRYYSNHNGAVPAYWGAVHDPEIAEECRRIIVQMGKDNDF